MACQKFWKFLTRKSLMPMGKRGDTTSLSGYLITFSTENFRPLFCRCRISRGRRRMRRNNSTRKILVQKCSETFDMIANILTQYGQSIRSRRQSLAGYEQEDDQRQKNCDLEVDFFSRFDGQEKAQERDEINE